jgi:hypothetical protein
MNQAELLQKLPREAAEAIQIVLATHKPTKVERKKYHNMTATFIPGDKAASEALNRAFTAVQFPGHEELIPLASALTEAQQALALLLSEVSLSIGDWALPVQAWCRRRWLGVDPPGVLEREYQMTLQGKTLTEPLWSLLQRLADEPQYPPQATEEQMAVVDDAQELLAETREDFWESLPLEERLAVYGEILLGAYGINHERLSSPLKELQGEDGKEWAPQYADRLLDLFRDDSNLYERGQKTKIPVMCKALLSKIFISAKLTLEPRWLSFITLSAKTPAQRTSTTELLRTLPKELQVIAILEDLKDKFTNDAIQMALALLDDFPFVELAQFLLDNSADSDRYPRRTILAELEKISTRHPALDALVSPVIASLPALPKLQWSTFLRNPDPAALTALQRQQCGAGSGGMMGAGESWVEDGESEYLELGVIVDEHNVAQYEAAIFLDEDGTFFRAGTAEPVAWLCQYRLDCEDPTLKEALQLLLAKKPKREDILDVFEDAEEDD